MAADDVTRLPQTTLCDAALHSLFVSFIGIGVTKRRDFHRDEEQNPFL